MAGARKKPVVPSGGEVVSVAEIRGVVFETLDEAWRAARLLDQGEIAAVRQLLGGASPDGDAMALSGEETAAVRELLERAAGGDLAPVPEDLVVDEPWLHPAPGHTVLWAHPQLAGLLLPAVVVATNESYELAAEVEGTVERMGEFNYPAAPRDERPDGDDMMAAHLVVFTCSSADPSLGTLRTMAQEHFAGIPSGHGVVVPCFQVPNVPFGDTPGTWRWP